MISSRNNETTSGPNYNRLHGATSNNRHSNFGTRSASPNMSRNRVHFNSLSNQEIPDERHNGKVLVLFVKNLEIIYKFKLIMKLLKTRN